MKIKQVAAPRFCSIPGPCLPQPPTLLPCCRLQSFSIPRPSFCAPCLPTTIHRARKLQVQQISQHNHGQRGIIPVPRPHLNKEATPVLELHCAQGWFGGGRHTDQRWPDTRSAYPDSQRAMLSAHGLGHSWRRNSGACLGHAKVTLMPRRNWHAKTWEPSLTAPKPSETE